MSVPVRMTQAEFNEAAKKAGYRFVCPMCFNVASAEQFRAAGADPWRVARECIGRLMNPMPKPVKGRTPCDWAAFGLFGELGRGVIVVMPDGKELASFAIAEAP